MVVVMYFIVTNACKGSSCFIKIPRLQIPFCFREAGKAASKRVSSQFSIFSDWVNITFKHVGVPEFMRNNRQGSKISVFLRDVIAEF